MTANILNTELTNIIQDAKKKNPDLRAAAEQSLQDFKAITVTSEAQLAADLRRRPRFISPFLLGCKSKSAKSTLAAVSCLQRLTVNKALPKEHLQDVLEAFQESISVSLDVQLRVLQALPSFLQNYGDALQGESQARVLQTCISLQQIKNTAVSNTASATLQQSVSSLFEKVEAEDSSQIKPAPTIEVQTDNGSVSIRPAAFDAYRTFKDICLMTQGQEPQYIRQAALPQTFGLELIETVLLNHADVINGHEEFLDLLLKHVMPLVNQFLSERLGFPLTVRTIRILCILVREHLDTIDTECEIALGLLNHTLESEGSQPWRRALCMEAFRVIYSNAELVIDVYSAFDRRKDRGNVIQDNLGLFVRMASEKPALIGLGQHSTVPSSSSANKNGGQEQAVVEAEAAVGMFGSDFGVSENNVPGISSQWSAMKVSCLDQLDKIDGPLIPETYIYSLVLTCINGLSDSLAKSVLPLSMHRSQRRTRSPVRQEGEGEGEGEDDRPDSQAGLSEGQKRYQAARSIPANPLDLKERSGHAAVVAVADLISNCWPAVLATASTFFIAALDAEYYRGLVRSFQKFTQVAGILRLATPRDALLTTLAKTAVPPSLLNDITASTPASPAPGAFRSIKGLLSPTGEGQQLGHEPAPVKPRQSSADAFAATLTQRNLMCLRALTHLAIALGPILDQSWNIVLETLQKASVLMATSGTAAMAKEYRTSTQSSESHVQPTLASEMAAVDGAVGKLMQTTNEYPTSSFNTLLSALCNILTSSNPPVSMTAPPLSPTASQRRVPSVSGIAPSAILLPQYNLFAIAKLGDLAKVNLRRLAEGDVDNGWDMLLEHLKDVASNTSADHTARQMAADVVASLAAESAITTAAGDENTRQQVQERCFKALKSIVDPLHFIYKTHINDAEVDIHQAALGSLRAILEHCGDAVITGWDEIFYIVDSVFNRRTENGAKDADFTARPLSAKLARSAFASLQLICSDFLGTLSASSYPVLVRILTKFCAQNMDMNISLSVVTLFWNMSDHLRTETSRFELPVEAFENGKTLRLDEVDRLASKGSVTASWLILQQNIAFLTQDSRGDVRNGSVHVLFRTLDSTGEQLTPLVWQAVLHTVLFKIMTIDTDKQSSIRDHAATSDVAERKALNQSSGLIIDSTAKVFVNFFAHLTSLSGFESIWHSILELFAAYIDCESYPLEEDVFIALARILAGAKDLQGITPHAVNEVASLWARAIPGGDDLPENDANARDKALLAYLKTLRQIHRLWKDNITDKQLSIVQQRLQECVFAARAAPYTVDISKETAMQAETLKCINMLRMHRIDTPGLLKTLADFVRIPYKGNAHSVTPQHLTFVAFAKSAMTALEESATELATQKPIYSDGDLASCLDAFASTIERKYIWKAQGPDPPLWRKATTHALNVLRSILQALEAAAVQPHDTQPVWHLIVRLGAALQSANHEEKPEDGRLIADETHDIEQFSHFRAMVTSHLDTDVVGHDIRLVYVHSLFRTSIVHPSRHDDDTCFSGEDGDQAAAKLPRLGYLKSTRLGRTHDPPFTPRIRMAHVALAELFRLVSQRSSEGDNSGRAGLLARVAFPFLVLRIAIPLKRYIADQPLRGRMPMPTSQRLELLHLLEQAANLECLEGASESTDRDNSLMTGGRSGKEHLLWLAPLVQRAIGCPAGDGEVIKGLNQVLGVIVGRER